MIDNEPVAGQSGLASGVRSEETALSAAESAAPSAPESVFEVPARRARRGRKPKTAAEAPSAAEAVAPEAVSEAPSPSPRRGRRKKAEAPVESAAEAPAAVAAPAPEAEAPRPRRGGKKKAEAPAEAPSEAPAAVAASAPEADAPRPRRGRKKAAASQETASLEAFFLERPAPEKAALPVAEGAERAAPAPLVPLVPAVPPVSAVPAVSPASAVPAVSGAEPESASGPEAASSGEEGSAPKGRSSRRRRSRRRRRSSQASAAAQAEGGASLDVALDAGGALEPAAPSEPSESSEPSEFSESAASPEASAEAPAPSKRSRRGRRGRRRSSRTPEEKAALAEDSSAPDYVSDDEDDEAESAASVESPEASEASEAPEAPEAAAPASETPSEAPARSKRSRRGRRRRSGPEVSIETQDVAVEPLDEEKSVEVPSDVFEELMTDALENAPSLLPEPSLEASVEGEAEAASDAAAPAPRRARARRTRGKKKALEALEAAEAAEAVAAAASPASSEEEAPAGKAKKASGADRKMLVSVLPGDQVEVVLTEEGKVREYYVEMVHQAKIRGNIYKGVISNVDANLQAAFVDFGAEKNGFLQIDEVRPDCYLQPHEPAKGRKYPPAQKVLKSGQEVLVQVVKEPNGSKGAFLTTWISLAGRFLVLTPGQEQIGVSRKVEDPEERARLRSLVEGIEPGKGLGLIVRTVSAGATKTTLQKDLNFLKRLWKDVRKRGASEKAPALLYQEPGLASRSVRDYLSDDVAEVWVDDEATAASIRETASLLFPRKPDLVRLYEDRGRTLWERFDVLPQLAQIYSREVIMPSGGRLVFDQTEALMAVDVNSGKIGGKTNFESTAYRTNMEAARTVAQQLRLRDVGGQVVVDFIEMRDAEQCRAVEKELRNAMKADKARHDVGKMSPFGLLQIVRQRTGYSAISISMEACPHCNGTGQRRTMEWQALQAQRELHRSLRSAAAAGKTSLPYAVEPELGLYLLNHKREQLSALEQEFGVRIEIRIDGVSPAKPAEPEKRFGKKS